MNLQPRLGGQDLLPTLDLFPFAHFPGFLLGLMNE